MKSYKIESILFIDINLTTPTFISLLLKHSTDLKVAMSDFGKVVIADHVNTARHPIKYLEAEHVIVFYAEQTCEQE